MSDEAEKAFDVWVSSERVLDADPRGQAHKAFMGCWRARDAEVAELREAFEEADSFAKVNAMNAADWFAMRTEVETLRQQLAGSEECRLAGEQKLAATQQQFAEAVSIAQEANDDCKKWSQRLAARDALIESQGRLIAALTGSIQDISTGWDKTLDQLAEREAVIERARAAWFGPCAFDLKQHGPAVTDALAAASPSAVLAEHDARVLEAFADTLGVDVGDEDSDEWRGYRNGQRQALRKAVERAAEYRKVAGQ